MSRILLQTTIEDAEDDWHVGRFSLLTAELRAAGHEVTARNRGPGPADEALLGLDARDHDQLWLLAVDTGAGIRPDEAEAILRFRRHGGGVLTARDHQDLGSSLLGLGTLGAVNHFHTRNQEVGACRDDEDNPDIAWPNYHSGPNGAYQPVTALDPIHPVLRTEFTASRHVEWLPAHPHEGSVTAPPDVPCARVIATGRSIVTGRTFNLAVVLDGEVDEDGQPLGRAIACSTFHHFADMNWRPSVGAPTFVTDVPAGEIEAHPARLRQTRRYVRNIAEWLHPARDETSDRAAAAAAGRGRGH